MCQQFLFSDALSGDRTELVDVAVSTGPLLGLATYQKSVCVSRITEGEGAATHN
jgi:hypothetical protein